MRLKLYEIPYVYDSIFESLDETGEITEDIQKQLDDIKEELQRKVENICLFILDLKQDAEVVDGEIKRLQARKKAFENKAEMLKNYLLNTLQKLGMRKVQTATVTAYVQNNPPSVQVLGDIPAEYRVATLSLPGDRVPVELERYAIYAPDKTKIKETIKAGKEVPGAELFQDVSLRIR